MTGGNNKRAAALSPTKNNKGAKYRDKATGQKEGDMKYYAISSGRP